MRDAILRTIDAVNEANLRGKLPAGDTNYFYKHVISKDPYQNIRQREIFMDLGFKHPEFAKALWMMCSRDMLFYINAFGWTLNPKEYSEQPLRPFITYKYQDAALKLISQAIGNHDIAVPKTRDMGASWMCLLAMEHKWHFRSLQQFLLTSEKEELVEGPSEKALFSKLDFWWDHLPKFLVPNMQRVKKHAKNLDNGSSFEGEATVENMATGDRRTAIMMDETSKMPGATKIFTSTRDVTKCRIFNSTPFGRFGIGEPFYRRVKMKATKKVFMHWSEHPEKSKGMYKVVDGVDTPLGPEYDWKDDYDFNTLCFPSDKPRSTWYDEQVERAQSRHEIAQELDIDFLGSSERFADEEVIMRVKKDYCQEPKAEGRITFDGDDLTPRWSNIPRGEFKFWMELNGSGSEWSIPMGEYAMGIDISAGTGGEYSSESAVVVYDRASKEQVAQFTSSNIRPEPFGHFCVGVAQWFHNAYMVPEVNGPGGTTFINAVKERGYYNVYLRKQADVIGGKYTRKLGWYNSDGGNQILGRLMHDLGRGEAKIRSELICDQFLEYEWKAGKLVHAASDTSDSASDKGKAHGDVAIAAACGWQGVIDRPATPEVKIEEAAPNNTMAYRLNELDMEATRESEESYTNW